MLIVDREPRQCTRCRVKMEVREQRDLIRRKLLVYTCPKCGRIRGYYPEGVR